MAIIGEDIKIISREPPPAPPLKGSAPYNEVDLFYWGEPNRFMVVVEADLRRRRLPPAPNPVDVSLDQIEPTAVEARTLTGDIAKNVATLRKFIVQELAPVGLAVNQAWVEARHVLRELTDAEDLDISEGALEFNRVLRVAVTIRIVDQITALYGLGATDRQMLLDQFVGGGTAPRPVKFPGAVRPAPEDTGGSAATVASAIKELSAFMKSSKVNAPPPYGYTK